MKTVIDDVRFSVIIPIYNAQKYLDECIISVINQTYKNLEIILINDGSKDDSLDIIKKIAEEDGRIIIADQNNSGVSATRNLGLTMASGEYIIFIDSDDYLMDNMAIEKICMAIEKNCDLIMFNIFYENKTTAYPLLEKSYSDKKELDDFLFRMIKNEHINSPCNKVYSRKIINEYNIQFDNNVKIGEDLLFNIEYLKYCKSIYYLKDTLYFYRKSNNNSATRTYMKNKYTDLMIVNDTMYLWLKAREDDRLINISNYIRIKNILSCIKDLMRKDCQLGRLETYPQIQRLINDNHPIIVRGCGIRSYILSLAYTFIASVASNKFNKRHINNNSYCTISQEAHEALVSVIVPVYGVEKYLRECVDSIINQTYDNIEIVLVDDGSPDNCPIICDEYVKKDKRVNVFHKHNEGVSITKNLGIKNANGKFITFIDADDYVREDFIENLVNDMTKYNTLITTTTKMHPIDEDNIENVEIHSQYKAFERLFYDVLEKSENGVQMFDRQLLVENKILFDPEKKVGEDFDFFVQALVCCDKVVVDYRKMYYYRPNPTSTMHQKINEGLMKSVTNFSSIGEELVKKHPGLQKAVDVKRFSDSVSLAMRSYDVRGEWRSEFRNSEYNIRNFKWRVLFDGKARKKVRAAAFVYCIFGNHIGTITLRKIKK